MGVVLIRVARLLQGPGKSVAFRSAKEKRKSLLSPFASQQRELPPDFRGAKGDSLFGCMYQVARPSTRAATRLLMDQRPSPGGPEPGPPRVSVHAVAP
jgi:hypothetical protein